MMDWIESLDSLDAAFAGFLVMFVISRVVSHSGLKLLDDASKVKLVDASARSSWFYVPLMAVIVLLFWHYAIGVIALAVYAVFAMFYNSWWHYRNEMPLQYQTRIMVSNGILLTGFLLVAIGFLINTAGET